MRIIKHGTIPEKTYRFACAHCGCIFELNEMELLASVTVVDPTLTIAGKVKADFKYECPDCKYTITSKGIKI